MPFAKSYILLIVLLILGSLQANAQRNCATVEYMNQLKNVESKEVFENWIYQKQIEAPNTGQESFGADEVTVYQIPVVIHIVHNGEAIGVGSNISESQILSQLEVLNEDYRKLNADSINIPAQFKALYSNVGFEFILAKRDPNNLATNGITRTQGSQTSWSISDDVDLKAHDYWPSEDYLNIWVADLCCGWLGWAQYPQSDILDGLAPPYNNTTDGVVITYDAFGSITKNPSANLQSRFDLGRTATHEIGHFFGLRHTWGDGGCEVDDYVTDTPEADNNYTACPSLGTESTSCGTQDMFMNYMDYVNDECMNIFSLGQKERMLIIMENSPRRLSLTTSLGLIPPNSEDLAITKFVTPTAGICNSQILTTIEVKNFGVSFINTTNISLYVNTNLVANQNFDFNLDVNQTLELTFNSIDLTDFGNLEFKAVIESVNGTTDGFDDNNTLIKNSLRAETVATLFEDFSSASPLWTVRTSQEISSLEKSQSVFYDITNTAAVFNYYNNENSADAYISPRIDLGTTSKTLLFDYSKNDALNEFAVLISTDCGNTFYDTLFEASNIMLFSEDEFSSQYTPVAFYPSGPKDWQHIQIDLSSYVNQAVIFSFAGKSKGGNRILIDNIQVVDNSYNDIALIGLPTPSTTCLNQNEITISVENKGMQPLVNLTLNMVLGAANSTITYPQLNLLPGKSINLLLPISEINSNSEIEVSLTEPDQNASNNSITQLVIPANSTIEIPLREKFESAELPMGWTLTGIGTNLSQGWNLANNRLEFIAANSPAKGLKEMIVLPPLNLSNLQSASMHFDFAYAFDGFNEELLRVKASYNCGDSYETIFMEGGKELATRFITTPWLPNGESDWKNVYVDLTMFAGRKNVQLVIELTSAQGNNAFVKNIELYASNVVKPLELVENTITTYPNPSTNGTVNISFNLSNSQPAKLVIYNSQGAYIFESEINTALNQTFEIQTVGLRNGMYFARLVGDDIDISRSFIVDN